MTPEGKNWHHTYPRRHRDACIKKHHETKLVDAREHRAWHALCSDLHPEKANRRIWALLFARGLQLTKDEKYARGILLEGRTFEEAYLHCIRYFLPTGIGVIKTPSRILLIILYFMIQKIKKHKAKVEMARKMRSAAERRKTKLPDGRKIGVGLFQTNAWTKRSEAIQERVDNRIIENDMHRQQRSIAAQEA